MRAGNLEISRQDISETVAALPHKQGTLVDLVVGLELQFKTIAWFQVVDGSALLRRQVSDPVYEEWQADRSRLGQWSQLVGVAGATTARHREHLKGLSRGTQAQLLQRFGPL